MQVYTLSRRYFASLAASVTGGRLGIVFTFVCLFFVVAIVVFCLYRSQLFMGAFRWKAWHGSFALDWLSVFGDLFVAYSLTQKCAQRAGERNVCIGYNLCLLSKVVIYVYDVF